MANEAMQAMESMLNKAAADGERMRQSTNSYSTNELMTGDSMMSGASEGDFHQRAGRESPYGTDDSQVYAQQMQWVQDQLESAGPSAFVMPMAGAPMFGRSSAFPPVNGSQDIFSGVPNWVQSKMGGKNKHAETVARIEQEGLVTLLVMGLPRTTTTETFVTELADLGCGSFDFLRLPQSSSYTFRGFAVVSFPTVAEAVALATAAEGKVFSGGVEAAEIDIATAQGILPNLDAINWTRRKRRTKQAHQKEKGLDDGAPLVRVGNEFRRIDSAEDVEELRSFIQASQTICPSAPGVYLV